MNFNLMEHAFIARVVDVNDPEKAGRIKIRILGLQDDTTKIPDKDLFWARPIFPVTNPAVSGVAGQTTGLMKDSTVVGFWADSDQQMPVVWGSLASAGKLRSDGTLDQTNKTSIPMVVREIDKNEVAGYTLTVKAIEDVKFSDLKTIGDIKYTAGSKLSSLIKSIDPSNVSGAIPNLLSGLTGVKSASGVLSQLRSQISSIAGGDLMKMASSLKDAVQNIDNIGTSLIKEAEHIGSDLSKAAGSLSSGSVISKLESSLESTASSIMPHIPAGLNPEQAVTSYITQALGGSVGPLIGKIKQVSSAQDITKIAGSFNFMKGKMMPNIDTAWSMIKQSVSKNA